MRRDHVKITGLFNSGYSTEVAFAGDEAYMIICKVISTLTQQRNRIVEALCELGVDT